jgi:chromosome segregation ATPase
LNDDNSELTDKYNDSLRQMDELKDKMESRESQFITTNQSLNRSLNELETRHSNAKDDWEEENDQLMHKINQTQSWSFSSSQSSLALECLVSSSFKLLFKL